MPFLKAIEKKGGEVYEVGGTLRDQLMGIPHKDKDLLVTQIPMKELIALLAQHGNVQLVGKSFGVLKFRPHRSRSEFDIALPRQESSTGTGHRDFKVQFDPFIPVEKDLGRRDFTINAMARNLKTTEMIDPFQGQTDLKNKILRQVFPEAFLEDPLRMLRAVQFAARFELEVEPKTLKAMTTHADLIHTVSPERVIEEIRKLLMAKKPSLGFYLMRELHLLPHLFPEIQKPGEKNFSSTLKVLDLLRGVATETPHLELLFAVLFEKAGKAAALQWMKKYPVSMIGVNPQNVATLVELYKADEGPTDDREIRRFASLIGKNLIYSWIHLRIAHRKIKAPQHLEKMLELKKRIDEALAKNPPLKIQDLALHGSDLMKMGFEEGPQLGKILKDLLKRVLDEPEENTREKLTGYVEEKFKNVLLQKK